MVTEAVRSKERSDFLQSLLVGLQGFYVNWQMVLNDDFFFKSF